MLSVPLPFVLALLLVILTGRRVLSRRDKGPVERSFVALMSAFILQSIVIGLRLGYGLSQLLPLQAVLAAVLPALAWIHFSAFAGDRGRQLPVWLHGLPAFLVLLMAIFYRTGIDLVLIGTFLFYGFSLLRLARLGSDALSRTPFEGTLPSYGALWATALALLLSGILDIVVALDIGLGEGRYAPMVVGFEFLMLLVLLGGAVAVASPGVPDVEAREIAPYPIEAEDLAIVAKFEDAMQTKELFRDADLSLDRLARKLGIPARQISGAINRTTGKNVSQVINGYRIAQACHLLATTSDPVTAVMMNAGFETKSNFNREFRRITGKSPSAWRSERRGAMLDVMTRLE